MRGISQHRVWSVMLLPKDDLPLYIFTAKPLSRRFRTVCKPVTSIKSTCIPSAWLHHAGQHRGGLLAAYADSRTVQTASVCWKHLDSFLVMHRYCAEFMALTPATPVHRTHFVDTAGPSVAIRACSLLLHSCQSTTGLTLANRVPVTFRKPSFVLSCRECKDLVSWSLPAYPCA